MHFLLAANICTSSKWSMWLLFFLIIKKQKGKTCISVLVLWALGLHHKGRLFAHYSSILRRRQWEPLQYSCLENPMDGGAWWAAVHGVTKSQTWLSDFTFTFHFHALEKEMQPTPLFLPGESQGRHSLVGCSLWGHRVGHDWSNLAAAAAAASISTRKPRKGFLSTEISML